MSSPENPEPASAPVIVVIGQTYGLDGPRVVIRTGWSRRNYRISQAVMDAMRMLDMTIVDDPANYQL